MPVRTWGNLSSHSLDLGHRKAAERAWKLPGPYIPDPRLWNSTLVCVFKKMEHGSPAKRVMQKYLPAFWAPVSNKQFIFVFLCFNAVCVFTPGAGHLLWSDWAQGKTSSTWPH